MGSRKDVMELFAERDLRQQFSAYDGWTITQVNGSPSTGNFYRISRSKWVGVETAYVAASFDQTPKDEIISALDQLPDGRDSKTRKYLLTPQATDTSAVLPHIRVLLMNAFAFANGDLVWLTKKKNAKVVTREQAVAA
jgi:hypothetical protein